MKKFIGDKKIHKSCMNRHSKAVLKTQAFKRKKSSGTA